MRFARFLVVGAANTAASYAVYLLLLLVVDYRIAYTVAYVAGLALGYWAHATFVFRARLGVRSAVAYVATYAAMYVAVAADALASPSTGWAFPSRRRCWRRCASPCRRRFCCCAGDFALAELTSGALIGFQVLRHRRHGLSPVQAPLTQMSAQRLKSWRKSKRLLADVAICRPRRCVSRRSATRPSSALVFRVSRTSTISAALPAVMIRVVHRVLWPSGALTLRSRMPEFTRSTSGPGAVTTSYPACECVAKDVVEIGLRGRHDLVGVLLRHPVPKPASRL